MRHEVKRRWLGIEDGLLQDGPSGSALVHAGRRRFCSPRQAGYGCIDFVDGREAPQRNLLQRSFEYQEFVTVAARWEESLSTQGVAMAFSRMPYDARPMASMRVIYMIAAFDKS